MSSGQQQVTFNNAERLVSDDHNRLQDFIARERNEIIRALVQQTWSPQTPGVTVRDDSGDLGTPLTAIVLDGLEAIVDNPGYVMISAGCLAGWRGTPVDAGRNSGFLVVESAGLLSLDAGMQISTNTGSVARCDVIEVAFNVDATVTYENRDVYDPGTENFIPESIQKTARSELIFRVRTGTPGVAPGVAYGWLPLALAIIQPGATLAQVDFYDVRPLYRDMHGSNSYEATTQGVTSVNRRSNHEISCAGDGTIAGSHWTGWCDAEYGRMDISGSLYRNTPINQTDLSEWGLTTTWVGGDAYGIPLAANTAVRGVGVVVSPYDTLILCACFPTLNANTGPLPRCVRYSQAAANNVTPTPARRRPRGVNGILLWVSKDQEGIDFTSYRSLYPIALSAPGFDGCVGNVNCVPIAVADIDSWGTGVRATVTGIAKGATVRDGVSIVQNQLVYITDLLGHINFSIDGTTEYPDEGDGAAVTNGAFDDDLAQSGDRIDIDVGRLVLYLSATGAGSAGIHITIIQDAYGTPLRHVLSEWFDVTDTATYKTNWQKSMVLTRSGVLRIYMALYCGLGTAITVEHSVGWDTAWGTYRRYRL